MKTTRNKRTIEVDKMEIMDQLLASMSDGRPTVRVTVTVVDPLRLIVLSPVDVFGSEGV